MGIRTPVLGLKIRCPRPLDDGAVYQQYSTGEEKIGVYGATLQRDFRKFSLR